MPHVVVYPAYVVLLGPCKEVQVPPMSQGPWFDNALLPRKSAIEGRLGTLADVPLWQRPDRPQDDAYRSCGRCMDFGRLKQKSIDPNWWCSGVHQILLWVGTSRPGQGAKGSKGKGKGKAKGSKGKGKMEKKGW